MSLVERYNPFWLKAVCLWLAIMMCGALHAQHVDSVLWRLSNSKLFISYDLDKDCDIRVRVSIDGGVTYSDPIQDLSGDVGKGIKAGKGKTITGENVMEIRGIEEWGIDFKVEEDDGSVVLYFDTLPIVMMPVKGGTFNMGGRRPKEASYDDERGLPVHEVSLSDYYIGRYEVTQALWKAVMGSNPSLYQGNDSLPVEQVTWNEVQTFIALLSQGTGYRFFLPSEAQWEYAARGGIYSNGSLYPGTNDTLFRYAWYCGNSGNHTHPVGELLPNQLGLYDMGGNVAEWCADWAAPYGVEVLNNPRGPRKGENRILRGGSINSPSYTCSVYDRGWYLPDHTYGCYGFRLAMESVQRDIE